MSRLNVAMVQDDWWPRTGGGPVHVRELSDALATECNCSVDIFTRSLSKDGESYTEPEHLADGNVTVHRLGPCTDYWNPVGRASSLVRPIPELVQGDYDVIHGHTFLPALPTRIGSMLDGAASVFTVHGTALTSGVGRDTTALSRVKRRVERQFVLEFDYDHVISVNEEHVPLLEQSHSDVTCIPNGVDLDRFDVDESPVDGRIVFLGRLAPKKRVSDLIRAFDQIEAEFDETELVIVGEGPRKDDLADLVSELGLDDRVTLTGRVAKDDIPHYYASAELFVLPSVWEGHPLTLLEAWAAGRPVIATDVEGIADGLRYALENSGEAQAWGDAARATAEAEFSWETAAERTRTIYDSIVY